MFYRQVCFTDKYVLQTSMFYRQVCFIGSKKELGTPANGQTVAVLIPSFDRGKGDSYLEK